MVGQGLSLSAKVFDVLEGMILNGEYKKGDSLIEIKISKQLGVSRTPVREALRQLEIARLVEIIPNRGAVVLGISQSDIEDIFDIRLHIEGLAAKWATERMTESELARLRESVDLLEFYASRNDEESVNKIDSTFHEIIYEASKNRILARTLFDFHNYIKKARASSFKSKQRLKNAVLEHKQILQAIEKSDAKLAESLATKHVENAFENINKANRGI